MIPFSRPGLLTAAEPYMHQAILLGQVSGGHSFTKKSEAFLDQLLLAKHTLLTTSCTHALEMAAHLTELRPGDEVIMPSFTFSSTATAFVLKGAVPVFVDIDPRTMNIDPGAIVAAVTAKTKAVVAVHYGGVACALDEINSICRAHNLVLIEDAAQCVLATYKGQPLGTFGSFGCFSFHESKNITCGEGGAIVCMREEDHLRAQIIREKGTDRNQFLLGAVDKYSWRDIGSSYIPSNLLAAMLLSQLENAVVLTDRRLEIWNLYLRLLKPLADTDAIELPHVPSEAGHNAHLFYIKLRDVKERGRMIEHLKANKIGSAFHYVPLHSSAGGQKFGRFAGRDVHTTKESERLLRLPLFFDLSNAQVEEVTRAVCGYFDRV